MFDSLKGKLKGLFKKTPEKLEETVYEDAPALPEKEDVPDNARSTIEPVQAPEADVLVKDDSSKPSRRDRVKAEKEQRKTATAPVGDSGKKIRDRELDSVLEELEVILFEADVAFSVAEEIKEGVRNNLTGKKYSRRYSLDEIVEMAVRDAVHDVLKV
ncbi:MAG: signal recognition particle receptor subunit alpha, partial [Candidatus Methanomethylophilaceae archaeon]